MYKFFIKIIKKYISKSQKISRKYMIKMFTGQMLVAKASTKVCNSYFVCNLKKLSNTSDKNILNVLII